jgi:hypothetical protein
VIFPSYHRSMTQPAKPATEGEVQGLTTAETMERLKQFGPNAVREERSHPWLTLLEPVHRGSKHSLLFRKEFPYTICGGIISARAGHSWRVLRL